jgi:hypothetical protein
MAEARNSSPLIVPERRQTVRGRGESSLPIVLIVVLLVVSGALASGGVRGAAPQVCSPSGCPSVAPIIAGVTATVQQGYRQAWVNWTIDGGTGSRGTPDFTDTFTWYAKGGSDNPIPLFNDTSPTGTVNLDALAAGTTYDYEIAASNSAGHASHSGSFTTSSAPSGEIVGWVSKLVSNLSELDQIGGAVSGATVGPIYANCVNPNGAPVRIGFPSSSSGVPVPAATTSGSGYYSATFPLTWTVAGYTYYDLYLNGTCRDNTFPGWVGTVSNSHVSLNATAQGYWSATQYLATPQTPGAGSFEQFGLQPNSAELVQVGLALVHTNYAACGFTYWTSTATSTVKQAIGLNSYQASSESTQSAQSWNSPGGWGSNNSLNLVYPFSGTINETGTLSPPAVNAASVAGPTEGADAVPINTTNWVTLTSTPPSQELPAGWHLAIPNSGQGETNPLSEAVYSEGTYNSTSGTEDSFGVPVGWGGASVSFSFSIQSTTTITTSIATTTSCSFAYTPDPSGAGGSPYFYFYDGASVGSTVAIPEVEVWLAGFCGGTGETAC